MTNHLSRAQLLLAQQRFSLAELEVRRVLAGNPDDASAHALLALALVYQQKYDEAEQEVGQAIVLDPDSPYAHYCRTVVLAQRHKFPQAEAAAREALRLVPGNPDFHAMLARALFNQEKWREAREAAEVGLQHDADHAGCNEVRTMALTQLGLREEAIGAAERQLARNPESATAHANKGWSLLHQRKHQEALEHFKESLRLEPTNEFARAGMVEALKARYFIYRVMLVFFLWTTRLSPRARWAVVIGGYFGFKVVQAIGRNVPQLVVPAAILMVAYLAFALMTWFASPLFNLMLRLNRFGRYALLRDQVIGSNLFGGCMLTAIVGLGLGLVTGSAVPLLLGIYAIFMALPLVVITNCDRGWPRQMMTLYTVAMGGLGLLAITGILFDLPWAPTTVSLFLLAFLGSQFVGNYLTQVTPTR